jgi:putative intracellular protease/amidase
MKNKKLILGAVIFDNFELLDLFGPLEMFGTLKDKIEIVLVSEKKIPIESSQGPTVNADQFFTNSIDYDILLIPGGFGTRKEVNNKTLINFIKDKSRNAAYVATVCTGAALLAKTGLLDGLKATTNKMAFDWVVSQNPNVKWISKARWVEDGKYFTSSGISAGIDMSLGLIEKIFNKNICKEIADITEYVWNSNKNNDPFAINR